MSKYDALFQPMKVGSVTIKNRIVMCPMGGTALIENNEFDQASADMYIERAKGGVGLIVPGIIHITDMWGRGFWASEVSDECMDNISKTLKELHKYDCKMFAQIGAGMGRVLSINSGMFPEGFNPVKAMRGPSEDLPNVWIPEKKHREMTKEEIQEIIDAYAKLSKRLKEAGMDGVEIHAIHEGYLLDQFSISATNWRKDEYGGSLENRMRFVCEIIHAIKDACGEDFPVSVRFSVTSKMKGFNDGALPAENYKEFGRSLEEAPAVAKILEEAGADMLNADNGSYDSWWWAHPPMYMPKACNLPEVSYIKNFVNIPVVCAGRMEDPDVALDAIESGKVDFVGIARQMLTDPEWSNKVAKGDVEDIKPCIACHNGCFGRLFAGDGTSCALNPAAMQEKKYEIKPATTKKKVLVVGGGIGGMEAARLASIRGHDVTLVEKTNELGGIFIAAAAFDFKEADRQLIQWYIRQMDKEHVNVILNTTVDKAYIEEMNPDEIIVATGAIPRVVPIKGIDGDNVMEACQYLLKEKEAGENNVIIGGGLTGIEIAYDLVKHGKKVSVVEAKDEILEGKYLSAANSNMLRQIIKDYQIPVYTSATITEINKDGLEFVQGNETHVITADSVITATGYIPKQTIPAGVEEMENVHIIGDANKVGNLMDAVWAAYDIALAI
ncbi:MAG: FAD-dependent oxidoreductase [Erysipelotrichaceae bacterium]|nr:FAD-dependent oxidoreductase [Erysipelotrichaceae bacterium]